MINSRNKGAQFEREVAAALYELTGFRFHRNLEQYRTKGLGDLISDDPTWPFLIECKRAAPANMRMEQWRRQALDAANGSGFIACVIYRLDRQPMRATIPMRAMLNAPRGIEWATLTMPGLCDVASGLTPWRKSQEASHDKTPAPHYTPADAPAYDGGDETDGFST